MCYKIKAYVFRSVLWPSPFYTTPWSPNIRNKNNREHLQKSIQHKSIIWYDSKEAKLDKIRESKRYPLLFQNFYHIYHGFLQQFLGVVSQHFAKVEFIEFLLGA